jgi:o-succinylbenzoate synthase
MVRLSAYTYSRTCTVFGEHYFHSRRRQGVLVNFENRQYSGIGEYAPLAGLHAETVEDVLSKLSHDNTLKLQEILAEASDDYDLLAGAFELLPAPWGYLMSMAHLHADFKRQIATNGPDHVVKLSALVEKADVNNAVISAQGYLAQGFHCLKIKVGSLSLKDEIKKVKTIEAIGGGKLTIRLDANKNLTFSEAVSIAKATKRLQYFEDPIADLSQAKNFYQETGVPVAIDESLPNFDEKSWDGIKFLIIKPSRLKNIYQLIKLAHLAKQKGLSLILSHCFESDFSAAMFALLIEKLNLSAYAHGIYAEGFFKENLYAQPLRSFRGQLFLDACRRFIAHDLLMSLELQPWSVDDQG